MLLYWNQDGTESAAASLLKELSHEFAIFCDAEGLPAGACRLGVCCDGREAGATIQRHGSTVKITYGRLCDLARAVGVLLAAEAWPEETVSLSTPFTHLGVMLDVSRNAVMKPAYLERWMRRLALLGYNRFWLYLENTYQLPGESYFGYLRGGYNEAELRRISDTGARLGIEVSGCIQALGHLEQVLKWRAYKALADTPSVLMVDEPAVAELLDTMIGVLARTLKSRTLHIGFDEAHDLGRGRHMDRFGPEPAFDLFTRHLNLVTKLCRKHGLKPQIWSDMLFRIGSATGDYYDRESQVPDEVMARIPEDVELVYWDYYAKDVEHYTHWIQRHQQLKRPLVVTSGIWTWPAFWYNHAFTAASVEPCIQACINEQVQDVVFALWGDDGAFCEYDSAWAGLCFAAEKLWTVENNKEFLPEALMRLMCGVSYQEVLTLSKMEWPVNEVPDLLETQEFTAAFIWDDPLYAMIYKNRSLVDPAYWSRFVDVMSDLVSRVDDGFSPAAMVDMDHGRCLCRFLQTKASVISELLTAYAESDRPALTKALGRMDEVHDRLAALQNSFRRQWLRRNRPHGMETVQNRLAGQAERWRELERRLHDYVSGEVEAIPEWDEVPDRPDGGLCLWHRIACSGL